MLAPQPEIRGNAAMQVPFKREFHVQRPHSGGSCEDDDNPEDSIPHSQMSYLNSETWTYFRYFAKNATVNFHASPASCAR